MSAEINKASPFEASVANAAALGVRKAAFAREQPLGFFVAAMLAGIYVGFAIILICAVGAPFAKVASPAVRLVTGASFGIALTLVVFAGAELFTGNVMFLLFSRLRNMVSWGDLLRVWWYSWVGNLVGALALAWLVVASQALAPSDAFGFVETASLAKIKPEIGILIGRAILCNMLVCLALWTASRTTSDAAKLGLIWWCLFAFIAPVFEHSVANMTLLGMGVIGRGDNGPTWLGFGYNMLWVTFGNIIGGALLALAYHVMAPVGRAQPKNG